jgi:LmbE family N-acetylglucosaminyl deacetylase
MSEGIQESPDAWEKPQKILVILAHPDDPEFFCGATLARWARAGHEIHYFLLTCGDKGFDDPNASSDQICELRHAEQKAAAAIIGVRSVRFLDLEDGYLVPSIELRRDIVRAIRQAQPDILVTCDPTHLFAGDYYINHPDHRYAGQVVLDAVFPAAGNPFFFPELITEEGLQPHKPREVWVSLTGSPTVTLDVTDTWEVKIRALKEHKSQIGDPAEFEQRMRARKSEKSTEENEYYEEKFRVIKFR